MKDKKFKPLHSSGSFESKRHLLELQQRQQQYQEEHRHVSHWTVVSPMTHHIIRQPSSPVRIKRVRSRSFNDYIDKREEELNGLLPSSSYQRHLLLPPLVERQPSSTADVPESSSMEATGIMEKTSTMDLEKVAMGGASLSPTEVSSTATTAMKSKRRERGKEAEADDEKEGNPIWVCVMYGMINATIVLPVIMSFGSIIYRNEAFDPYMPVLIKLTLLSGVVHQVCFSTLSSLPFAVGSVQDAGLIFLSGMAGQMVDYCRSRDYTDEKLLATVTVGLATGTAILGVGLIIIGKLKLATYVQMLPTCVVGGYLAFIGWFCGVSGVGIMVGKGELTLTTLTENILFVIPGLAGGILIYWSVRTLKHVAVLPVGIIILLVLFYVGLVLADKTIEDATSHGWIRASDPAPVWYHSWDYLQLENVDWLALPQLLLTELSMIFVVAFSSSLDVAAIELELNKPLDYNHELSMIGISNVISGCTGGYTGSYIFSQSIFSLRAGIRSRLAGYVLALCQVAIITTPFQILSFIPNFFYGSLLTMICVDLVYEWLWDIRTKVTTGEYCICLSTFGLIQILGVEYGILAGVALYFTCRKLGFNVGELRVVVTHEESSEEEEATNNETEEVGNGHNHGDGTNAKLTSDYGSMDTTNSSTDLPSSGLMI